MNDEEIEKAVLYFMIYENCDCDVSEIDFVNQIHKQIIKAINELKTQKEKISVLTINNKISSNTKEILKYLSDLGNYVFNTSFQTAYQLLKKYSKKRQVYENAREIQSNVSRAEDIDVFIEKTISNLQKIEFQTTKEENFVMQLSDTINLLEEQMKKDEDYSLYTGFFELDAITDGLHGGEVTIVGARPRSRKNYFFITDSSKYSF